MGQTKGNTIRRGTNTIVNQDNIIPLYKEGASIKLLQEFGGDWFWNRDPGWGIADNDGNERLCNIELHCSQFVIKLVKESKDTDSR